MAGVMPLVQPAGLLYDIPRKYWTFVFPFLSLWMRIHAALKRMHPIQDWQCAHTADSHCPIGIGHCPVLGRHTSRIFMVHELWSVSHLYPSSSSPYLECLWNPAPAGKHPIIMYYNPMIYIYIYIYVYIHIYIYIYIFRVS